MQRPLYYTQGVQGFREGERLTPLEWILNAIIFFLVFSFIPFFTGTQNTYFLQAVASVEPGWLSYDWETQTIDSKPAFTYLIRFLYQITGQVGLYLLYIALLGVYMNTLISLINETCGHFFRSSYLHRLGLLALLLTIHSFALYVYFDRFTGIPLHPIFLYGLARQVLLDHYLQSQSVGVLLLPAILACYRKKYILSVGLASGAALFHISFIIPAAILTMICLWKLTTEGGQGSFWVIAGVSGLLVLPIIIYTIVYLWPMSTEAKDILFNFRIPHHANPFQWSPIRTAIQVLVLVFGFVLMIRNRDLAFIYAVFLVFVIVTTLIQMITASHTIGLLFPWRISIVLVPWATCTIGAVLVWQLSLTSQQYRVSERLMQVLLAGWICLLIVGGVYLSYKKVLSHRQYQTHVDELKEQIQLSESSFGNTLIPVEMEDFRLSARVPVFVDEKNHPFQSEELVEWYRRVQLANRFYHGEMSRADQLSFIRKEEIKYIVADAQHPLSQEADLQQIFKNEEFLLYKTNVSLPLQEFSQQPR